MPYEQRDNSGSLFRNDKRESDSHPNMKGSAMIGGAEYWVSAWTKVGKTGEKWVSLAFTPKESRIEKPATTPALENWGEEIPF
jgi:hypothetical protein